MRRARGSFSKQVTDWCSKSEKRVQFVMRESVALVLRDANRPVTQGGNLPFKDGNLRNTLVSRVGGIPGSDDATDYMLVLSSWDGRDTFYAGWSAAYARRMEYGFVGADSLGRVYNQRGFAFREKAVQKWDDHVEATVRGAMRLLP